MVRRWFPLANEGDFSSHKGYVGSYDFEGCTKNPPVTVGKALDGLFSDALATRLSENQRAAVAWFRANGDIEHAHTTGVFLKRRRADGLAPVLGVYVDSHARLTDFSVNREVYLSRLAAIGFEVSGIEFRLSRRPASSPVSHAALGNGATHPSLKALPPLTAAEEERVAALTEDLPDHLRARAATAMRNSLRRERYEGRE